MVKELENWKLYAPKGKKSRADGGGKEGEEVER